MASAIEILLGAILSILITILIEYLRKPKITMELIPPTWVDYAQLMEPRPARLAVFLRARLKNKPLPKLFRWLSRNAALQAHANITFYHLDGQPVFGSAMAGRWSGTPEPAPPLYLRDSVITVDGILTFNINSQIESTRRDIYPGEQEDLDIVARFDDEPECYGWNDQSYASRPPWRNPAWQLPRGRFLVKVEILSAGDRKVDLYRICNDVDLTSFRLEPALKGDVQKILS